MLDAAGEQVAALDRDGVAVHVLAVATTSCLRMQSKARPGDGQAALIAILTSSLSKCSTGLIEVADLVVDVVGEHGSDTPICGAARPTPGASSIVSVRSLTRVRISLSKVVTSSDFVRSTGSPNSRIGRSAMRWPV